MDNHTKIYFSKFLLATLIISSVFGALTGFLAGSLIAVGKSGPILAQANNRNTSTKAASNTITTDEEVAVESAVERVSPAVVSIIVTKDLPKLEQVQGSTSSPESDFFQQFFGGNFPNDFFNTPQPQYQQNGTQKQEVGGGTGFIVSSDGYIVTNAHVTSDTTADYTVLMNDGSKYPAKILASDPVLDVSVLKINANNKKLPVVELGDSSNLKVGQSVIAIGNALGEFRNTVSTGVISGLSRSVTAGGLDSGGNEQLSGVIQTDASINFGNSGGPLLNISGQVIGINTAIVQGAQNIGFAIPINEIKSAIESVKQNGRIITPYLGLRYITINKAIADANNLSVDYGALVTPGQNPNELAVIPGSPADKAGIKENDIILEVNGQKLDSDHPLVNEIRKYKVGDTVDLKILSKGQTKDIKVKLEEAKQ